MKSVFIALLTEHSSGNVTDKGLFETAVSVAKNSQGKSGKDNGATQAQRASYNQSRELAFNHCQVIKNHTASNGALSVLYPDGTKQSYASKVAMSADMVANFDTYFPSIL